MRFVRLSAHSCLLAFASVTQALQGQTLTLTPNRLVFRMTADSPFLPPAQVVQINSTGDNVEFEFAGATTFGPNGVPNFVSVSPNRAKSPAALVVSVDPEVAAQIGTTAESGVEVSIVLRIVGQDATRSDIIGVTLIRGAPPIPVITAVLNAASRRSGPISPGGIITILGANICPLKDRSRLVEAIPGSRIFYYLTDSGGTQVMINGVAVPILYCEGGQVNAVVPFGVQVPSRAEIVVKHYNVDSSPVSVEVAESVPAILSVNQSGDGQGLIFNSGEILNSLSNPVQAGEAVRIFATGAGVLEPPAGLASYVDRVGSPRSKPTAPVSLTIGGKTAEIKSATTAQAFISSIIVIEALIPEGLSRGLQPVVLKIGANTNAVQHITVAQ